MKSPPFSKPLRELLQSGQSTDNSIYLYIGDYAWDKGKNSSIMRPSRTLILPPNESPLVYDWPVYGCDILLIETSLFDTDYIEHFVHLLLSYGATKVVLIAVNLLITTYKKDF